MPWYINIKYDRGCNHGCFPCFFCRFLAKLFKRLNSRVTHVKNLSFLWIFAYKSLQKDYLFVNKPFQQRHMRETLNKLTKYQSYLICIP